jgi:hypothetical protein
MTTESERVDLGQFEGRPVIECGIVIPNSGGGLHDALGLDPVLLHTGDEIDVLLRCTVGKITHDPIVLKGEDQETYRRVATLHADKGAILDDKSVGSKVFTKQSTRLAAVELEKRKREEAEAGVQPIPGTEDL